jgi:hypothetical protein
MKTKKGFSKFVSAFTVIALLAVLVGPQFADATVSLSKISDSMSRQKAATKSTHLITFKSTTAIPAAGTIAINFATFTGTIAVTDVQICHGQTTGLEHGTPTVSTGPTCGGGETVTGTGGASTVWQAVYSSTTLTLTAPTGTMTNPINAGDFITVYVSATNIQNPAVSTPAVTITNSNGDSGSFTVAIVDDDTVAVSATVNETLTFSTNASTANTAGQHSLPLGILSTAAATYSNGTIPSIWVNISTNTPGGAIVSVQSANGALVSTSKTADTIPSTTATMAPGTANYGICVKNTTQTVGTLTKLAPFASSCSYSATDSVGAVTTTPQTILNTNSTTISTGVAEIVMSAENSATTPAHTDYADTLTLIGTGTF